MAKWFSVHLVLVPFIIAALCRPISTAESPPPTPPTPPPPPSPSTMPPPPWGWSGFQEQQFRDIIDALISTGDFRGWATLLSATNRSTLPLSATLFIPGDDALSHLVASTISFDPFIVPYHIVPLRLSFPELQLFETNSRLPTLLPSNSIIITNNSTSNFSVDASPITHPDLYSTPAVAVHGVKSVLDYAIYGGGGGRVFFPPPPPPLRRAVPKKVAPPPPNFPAGEVVCCGGVSDSACLCSEFPVVLLGVFAALAFKIQGNPLVH